MEAVEVAAGGFELFDPAMRLRGVSLGCWIGCDERAYLCDHHVTVEGPSPAFLVRPGAVRADVGDDGGADGHVGDEVAVHDVDMEPVGALVQLG